MIMSGEQGQTEIVEVTEPKKSDEQQVEEKKNYSLFGRWGAKFGATSNKNPFSKQWSNIGNSEKKSKFNWDQKLKQNQSKEQENKSILSEQNSHSDINLPLQIKEDSGNHLGDILNEFTKPNLEISDEVRVKKQQRERQRNLNIFKNFTDEDDLFDQERQKKLVEKSYNSLKSTNLIEQKEQKKEVALTEQKKESHVVVKIIEQVESKVVKEQTGQKNQVSEQVKQEQQNQNKASLNKAEQQKEENQNEAKGMSDDIKADIFKPQKEEEKANNREEKEQKEEKEEKEAKEEKEESILPKENEERKSLKSESEGTPNRIVQFLKNRHRINSSGKNLKKSQTGDFSFGSENSVIQTLTPSESPTPNQLDPTPVCSASPFKQDYPSRSELEPSKKTLDRNFAQVGQMPIISEKTEQTLEIEEERKSVAPFQAEEEIESQPDLNMAFDQNIQNSLLDSLSGSSILNSLIYDPPQDLLEGLVELSEESSLNEDQQEEIINEFLNQAEQRLQSLQMQYIKILEIHSQAKQVFQPQIMLQKVKLEEELRRNKILIMETDKTITMPRIGFRDTIFPVKQFKKLISHQSTDLRARIGELRSFIADIKESLEKNEIDLKYVKESQPAFQGKKVSYDVRVKIDGKLRRLTPQQYYQYQKEQFEAQVQKGRKTIREAKQRFTKEVEQKVDLRLQDLALFTKKKLKKINMFDFEWEYLREKILKRAEMKGKRPKQGNKKRVMNVTEKQEAIAYRGDLRSLEFCRMRSKMKNSGSKIEYRKELAVDQDFFFKYEELKREKEEQEKKEGDKELQEELKKIVAEQEEEQEVKNQSQGIGEGQSNAGAQFKLKLKKIIVEEAVQEEPKEEVKQDGQVDDQIFMCDPKGEEVKIQDKGQKKENLPGIQQEGKNENQENKEAQLESKQNARQFKRFIKLNGQREEQRKTEEKKQVSKVQNEQKDEEIKDQKQGRHNEKLMKKEDLQSEKRGTPTFGLSSEDEEEAKQEMKEQEGDMWNEWEEQKERNKKQKQQKEKEERERIEREKKRKEQERLLKEQQEKELKIKAEKERLEKEKQEREERQLRQRQEQREKEERQKKEKEEKEKKQEIERIQKEKRLKQQNLSAQQYWKQRDAQKEMQAKRQEMSPKRDQGKAQERKQATSFIKPKNPFGGFKIRKDNKDQKSEDKRQDTEAKGGFWEGRRESVTNNIWKKFESRGTDRKVSTSTTWNKVQEKAEEKAEEKPKTSGFMQQRSSNFSQSNNGTFRWAPTSSPHKAKPENNSPQPREGGFVKPVSDFSKNRVGFGRGSPLKLHLGSQGGSASQGSGQGSWLKAFRKKEPDESIFNQKPRQPQFGRRF